MPFINGKYVKPERADEAKKEAEEAKRAEPIEQKAETKKEKALLKQQKKELKEQKKKEKEEAKQAAKQPPVRTAEEIKANVESIVTRERRKRRGSPYAKRVLTIGLLCCLGVMVLAMYARSGLLYLINFFISLVLSAIFFIMVGK